MGAVDAFWQLAGNCRVRPARAWQVPSLTKTLLQRPSDRWREWPPLPGATLKLGEYSQAGERAQGFLSRYAYCLWWLL